MSPENVDTIVKATAVLHNFNDNKRKMLSSLAQLYTLILTVVLLKLSSVWGGHESHLHLTSLFRWLVSEKELKRKRSS